MLNLFWREGLAPWIALIKGRLKPGVDSPVTNALNPRQDITNKPKILFTSILKSLYLRDWEAAVGGLDYGNKQQCHDKEDVTNRRGPEDQVGILGELDLTSW